MEERLILRGGKEVANLTRATVLRDPSTHYLVGEILELVDRHDPVDALHDLELATEILRQELTLILERP